jgi:predicted HTH domain antitoxin
MDKRELLDELELAGTEWRAAKARERELWAELVPAIRRAREAGVSVAYIVEVAGVSRQWVYSLTGGGGQP